MTENTSIGWTDHTFNAWLGCTRFGPGCHNCYAEKWAKRSGLVTWGKGQPRRLTTDANWAMPHRWNARAQDNGRPEWVFCGSLMDWADREVPDAWRTRLFALIRGTPWLRWQLLSKRVEEIARCLPEDWGRGYPNVALGMTAVNNDELDRDAWRFLKIPVLWHFLSYEPGLEGVDLRRWLLCFCCLDRLKYRGPDWVCTKCGHTDQNVGCGIFDQVIIGGESGGGRKARAFDPDWARRAVADCRDAGVKVYVKQMGSVWARENKAENRKGEDPAEWPDDLRVQERLEDASRTALTAGS